MPQAHARFPPTRLASRPRDGRPWNQPWWRPAPGKSGVLAYLLLIHILAIAGLILFPLPGWRVFGVAAVLATAGSLGTTIGYHRLLAHRTLRLNPVVEQVLIFAAMFNGSGAPASWVAYHRLHHAGADTEQDISSPSQGGFWWAHLRWLYQSPRAESQRWCPDLDHGRYRAWRHAEVPVLLLSLGCGLALGWAGFFWIGAIRLVYCLHLQCFVNSLTHLGPAAGRDRSQNVWWLGPLQLGAWGENWHANHHAAAGVARFGRRWWQVDIGWYLICALEAVGLADRVKRPVTRSAAVHNRAAAAPVEPHR
jgi:fatty-acid desaturase